MSDDQLDQTAESAEAPAAEPGTQVPAGEPEEARQYGVGPFSIREVVLGGIWLAAFVVSFFPVIGVVGAGPSVWGNGIDWVLTIGVPTAAVFLLGLRRLSPDGIRRVGSLGIDQFASVAFSVSTIVWLSTIWNSFITLASSRVFLATWVVWVEFFLMLAGTLLTVFGPFIAPFDQDFLGRPETPAHRNARPVRAISRRPAAVPAPVAAAEPETDAPVGAEHDDATSVYAVPVTEPDVTDAEEIVEADEAPVAAAAAAVDEPAEPAQPVRHQAFWALVPEERDIVDEVGLTLFRIGPTAWALVIEDRGESFVVRHEDGRIGYLHDTTDVTRG